MRAFLKKEWMEAVRTGRLWILLLVFALFGIMNPAIAKLTPWMLELMGEQLAGTGIRVGEITVDAITSWTQFYKNMPMALIIFVLFGSGSFTVEYQRGTLIPVVTKGLSRRKVAAAKMIMLAGMWTALYAICAGITYGYNVYFWDNGTASSWAFGVFCFWLFGLWVIGWLVLFSTVVGSSTQVLLGTGAVVTGAYVLGLIPVCKKLLPAKLMGGLSLLQGMEKPGDFFGSILTTCLTILLCVLAALIFFDRKKL